jgi:hypothetical protein
MDDLNRPSEGAAPEPRILVFSLWFGRWPEWMRFFLASCRANPSIDWLLIGDDAPPQDLPPNVRVMRISLADYRALIAKKLDIAPQWNDAYKICDVRPALAAIHEEEISRYDYWGYCDLDVIFGDIRRIYTPETLTHDIISPHAHVVAGHFTLFRNIPRVNQAFRKIPSWQNSLSTAEHKSFDEQIFSRLYMPFPLKRKWRRLFTPFLGGALLVERYSTAIRPLRWIDGGLEWPEQWFWNQGRLTTSKSGEREMLYLHFSHWQSNRWTAEGIAPWRKLERLDNLPPGRPDRFVISAKGFTPFEADDPAPAKA